MNVLGVLQDTQAVIKNSYWAQKEAFKTVESWLVRKGKRLSKRHFSTAFVTFQYVLQNFPLDAITTDEEDPESFKQKLVDIREHTNSDSHDCIASRRDKDNHYVLDCEFNRDEADCSRRMGCIQGFEIYRSKDPALDQDSIRPVKTLMIFVSEKHFDIADPVLKVYDNITSVEKLQMLNELDRSLARISYRIEGEGMCYCLFERTRHPLKPALWINFYNDSSTENILVTMLKIVTGTYIIVKLIDPDNPTAPDTRLFCKSVIPYGKLIQI